MLARLSGKGEPSLPIAIAIGIAHVGAYFLYRHFTKKTKIEEIGEDDHDDENVPYNIAEAKSYSGPRYRMYLVVRSDLGMGKGKMCAQCAHAAVDAVRIGERSVKHRAGVAHYLRYGAAKIAVKISSEAELMELWQICKEKGYISTYIVDAGHTQLAPNTTTVLAVLGPTSPTPTKRDPNKCTIPELAKYKLL